MVLSCEFRVLGIQPTVGPHFWGKLPVYQVCWAGEGGNNSLVVAKVGKLE